MGQVSRAIARLLINNGLMSTSRILASIAIFVVIGFAPATAQPVVDDSVLALIEHHTIDNGQVMEIARTITDLNGPRLTGSPGLDAATEKVVTELEEWGLDNVHLSPWGPFGRGWELNRFSMHVTSPATFPVLAFPKAWSSGTGGTITGEVVLVDAQSPEDLERYRGQLKGKIVLASQPMEVEPDFEGEATRRTDAELLGLASGTIDEMARRYSPTKRAEWRFQSQVLSFVYDQGPALIVDRSYKADRGTIAVSQALVPAGDNTDWRTRPKAWEIGREHVIPQVSVSTEHYNRLYRLAKSGEPLEIEVDLNVTWHDDDPMENNIIADIPGTDPEIGHEIVMIGAHFDSWHAGTGATDNGAGSSVMMEVMRVLKQVYLETGSGPRRTIRLALWTGEEQGLLGSKAYIKNQVAEGSAEWNNISAYYNLDNGTGRIRGVYLQGNHKIEPIFREWLKPYTGVGAQTLSMGDTGGTDHLSFDNVGIPGFQFIQDPIAYSPVTHHSNMDTFDHLIEEDLKQAATVIAGFVYNTAQRDEKLPRKELAKQHEAEVAN
jgi:carboxypeptidase Q